MNYVFAMLVACLLLQGCGSIPQAGAPNNHGGATELIMPTTVFPSATIVSTVVPDPTPTDEWYEYAGCETLSHPRYPQRLLYPDYRDLIQTSTPTDLSEMRSTTFTSSASATTIMEWYREQALAAAWQEKHVTATMSEYVYTANAVCGPAFSMTVAVTSDATGSVVTIIREMSGPFSPAGWPPDA